MKCDNCSSEETYIKEYECDFTIKGKTITVKSKRRFCKNCNSLVYDEELDNITSKLVNEEYNRKYGILPEEITRLRKQYNLSLDQLSKIIGCAKKTLISYEKGTSIPNDTNKIIFKSLLSKPDIIDILLESNKDSYTDKEYNKIKEKILKFISNNNLGILTEHNGYTKQDNKKVLKERIKKYKGENYSEEFTWDKNVGKEIW